MGQIRHSACTLDCPDACSLQVTVEAGVVTKLDADERNPLTPTICGKVRKHFVPRMYGEHRLKEPAIRIGAKGKGEFRVASWDEALQLICDKLRTTRDEYGGEAILPLCYGGSNGYLTQDTLDARLFRRLGASQLLRTVCAAPTGAVQKAMYGRMPGVALTDYEHAKLIVVWGANPVDSGIHILPIISKAQKKGARLVVIDPRRTKLARQADLHLAINPGTDACVALAIHRWLFEQDHADDKFLKEHACEVDDFRERCAPWTFERAAQLAGVTADNLQTLAQWYVETNPAVIRCGWGPERNRNAGSSIAAIIALPAVAGKFGVRGGGYTMSNSGAWSFNSEAAIAQATPSTRAINMNQAGQALAADTRPPIKTLFVYNCNPVATLPNQQLVRQGLLRDDLFTVVFEQVMTDTCQYADVLLPATTFLEHDEIYRGYGSLIAYRSAPAVDAVGQARSNVSVFGELIRRLGLQRPDDENTADALVNTLTRQGAAEKLATRDYLEPDFGRTPIQMQDVRPRTADGKIHLVPRSLDEEAAPFKLYEFRPDPKSEAYPLALISPATKYTINSTLGEMREGQVPLQLHPEDAQSRDIKDGDTIRVYNDLGEVHCLASLDTTQKPGVVCLPKGMWAKHSLNGNSSNSLSPDDLTDVGGGACFNDARVQVERGRGAD